MPTAIYRPNADGSYTNIWYPSGVSHYNLVDEDVSDDFTTKVYSNINDTYVDTYNFANPVERGIINSVTVYVRCCSDSGVFAYSKPSIYTSGQTIASGSLVQILNTWSNVSNTWTVNPWTSTAWTWKDLDSLEIGVGLYYSSGPGYIYCTQVWIAIDYTPAAGGGQVRFIGMAM